jgi:hypothetical protein
VVDSPQAFPKGDSNGKTRHKLAEMAKVSEHKIDPKDGSHSAITSTWPKSLGVGQQLL